MSEGPDQPGAWGIVQPPIYIMGPASDVTTRAGDRIAAKAKGFEWGPMTLIVAGAAATAFAAYLIPRVMEKFEPQSDTVDLDVQE